MERIGDKILIGNPEDQKNLRVLELNDVYEVGPNETYFEFIEYASLTAPVCKTDPH
jgi:hypothetical protein